MRLPRGIRRFLKLDRLLSGVEEEVDAELRHHFDTAVDELIEQGVPQQEALEIVHRRFGDEAAYRDALVRISRGRSGMQARSETMDWMVRAVTHSVRRIRRSPAFSASIVLILALGIGANAVMFGVVDRLLLSPPQHIVDADEVKLLHVERVGFNGDTFIGGTITWPDLLDFSDVGAFAEIAAYTEPRAVTVGRGADAAPTQVATASALLFSLLGVSPHTGRFYYDEEDRPGATPTIVLSHEYWTRQYGADPGVLGSTIDVDDGTFEIIGITPPGFTGAQLSPVDLWAPIQTFQAIADGEGWEDNRGWYWFRTVARLAPGASVEAAEEEATAAHRAGRAEMIEADRYDEGARILVAPIIAAQGPDPTSEARVARWLAGVSFVVLLIACFNVANLLLARGVQGGREVAVRLALGAGRKRLLAELMLESLFLSALGALAGVAVASILGRAVHQALLPGVAFSDAGLTTRIVGFTLIATALAGLTAGLLPALQASRADLTNSLRSGGRASAGGRSRLRVLLLTGQAALSVVLLVGAGLFVESLRRAEGVDLGFDAGQMAIVTLEWNETLPALERQALYEQAQERARRLPAVHAAGLTYTIPFRSSMSLGQPRVPGLDSVPRHHNGGPYLNKVSEGFFSAAGLEIVEGRAFDSSDGSEGAAPVAIVSESMARAYWPAGDALGSCMLFSDEPESVCTTVVGVVENHRRQALVEDDPHFLYYVNQPHPDFSGPPQALMLGTTGDPAAMREAIRQAMRAIPGPIRFVGVESMSELVEPSLRSWRMGASMFTVFGLLALLVAGWGLYSVLAFDVALRKHELGVRSALGAGVPRLVKMVLRQALALIAVGTVVGLGASAAAARFIEPLLFGVSGRDPFVYVVVAVTLVGVAAVAGWIPAMRATRVDPREALASE